MSIPTSSDYEVYVAIANARTAVWLCGEPSGVVAKIRENFVLGCALRAYFRMTKMKRKLS